MALRQIVRGSVPWPQLEAVAREVAERYGRASVRVAFLDADNWLSTPCVVDEEWFVKVISPQNSLVHALFTTGRNIGAFTSGTEGFFDHYGTPLQMARHELDATEKMREVGLNAPEPVEAFEVDGFGVLVLEYLPEFRTLDDVDREAELALAPAVFEALARMHENGLAHGDVRGENVLILDDEVYFIDATKVNEDNLNGARAYDLASALATLEPLIGGREAVAAALTAFSIEELLTAVEFLGFVNLRPDHDFDAAQVKGEIEKLADQGT